MRSAVAYLQPLINAENASLPLELLVSEKKAADKNKAREPGPGYYDSHVHKTLQTSLAKRRQRMSRQNPGFGASSPAHTLPYEVDIANDQKPFREMSAVEGSFSMGGGGGGRSGGVTDHLSA